MPILIFLCFFFTDCVSANDCIESGWSAERQMPEISFPGDKFEVKISVKPSGDVVAYAVEDSPPAGWIVS